MKSYFSKSLSIFALIIAFGCSEEQTILPEEESSNQKELLKAEKAALESAARRPTLILYVECPGTFGTTCPQDLDSSITVYHVYQSPNCPNTYKVWVDKQEYEAIFTPQTQGTKHVVNPPYEDEPRHYAEEDYNTCFN